MEEPGRGTVRVMQLLAPGAYGGLERVVTQLSTGLARRGWPSAVVAILDAGADEPPVLDEMRTAGVTVFPVPVPPRAYRLERHQVGVVVDRWRPQVANTHGYRADVNLRPVLRARRVPLVGTAHGFTGGGWKNRLFEWLDRRALGRCEAAVAVSRPLGARLRSGGVRPDRLHVIPNAWAPSRTTLSRAEARERLGLPQEAVAIGWVGRLGAEKGPDVAVSAMARLRHPTATLSLVGAGREEPALRALASRLGVEDRIRWHGGVAAAGELMAAFDAFCLSSRTEGTPMALLEAMAIAVPVVVTQVGGVPDIVSGQEAVLVPSEDPDALAAALDFTLTHPAEADARARRARRKLETAFDMEPWLDRYQSLYRSLTGS